MFVALKFRFILLILSVSCNSTCCQTFGLETPFEFYIFCCFTHSGIEGLYSWPHIKDGYFVEENFDHETTCFLEYPVWHSPRKKTL